MLQRILAGEAHLFAVADFHGRALAGGLTVTFTDRHPSLVIVGVDVEAIDARLHYGERQVRGIDFVDLTRLEVAHGEFENALVEFAPGWCCR